MPTARHHLPPTWKVESAQPVTEPVQKLTENDFEVRVIDVEEPVARADNEPVIRLEVQTIDPKPKRSAEPLPVVARPVSETDAPIEQVERGYRDGESWGIPKLTPTRWILLSGGFVLLLVIASVLVHLKFRWEDEVRGKSFFSGIEVVDQSAKDFSVGDFDLGGNSEAEGRELFAKYAAATTVDEILPMIRNASLLEDAIRANWKPLDVPEGWVPPNRSSWSFRKAGNRDFGFLGGMMPDFTPFAMYFVSENGKVLIDWEASTGYGESSFTELNAGTGKGGLIRGLISQGDLYTSNFPEADFRCFRMKSPDRETIVWLYTLRKSKEEEFITKYFTPGAIPGEVFAEFPITLRVDPPQQGSLKNQWMIREVLHIDWISP